MFRRQYGSRTWRRSRWTWWSCTALGCLTWQTSASSCHTPPPPEGQHWTHTQSSLMWQIYIHLVTHTLICCHTQHILSHTYTHIYTPPSLSHTYIHTLSLSLTHTHTYTFTLTHTIHTLSHMLSLSHINAHALWHSLSHIHTLPHPHTQTHTHKFLNLQTMYGAEVVTAHMNTTGYMTLRSMKRSAKNSFSNTITLAGSVAEYNYLHYLQCYMI